ncbi:MAG: hypothetical protein JSV81_20880 [Anaerolineales bacterium]|nr:MAG: hypothetical protein JSV81_20880 [Anaerolineales bacterium]
MKRLEQLPWESIRPMLARGGAQVGELSNRFLYQAFPMRGTAHVIGRGGG